MPTFQPTEPHGLILKHEPILAWVLLLGLDVELEPTSEKDEEPNGNVLVPPSSWRRPPPPSPEERARPSGQRPEER